jgi:lipid II:glycine glycyltransferase (peptidoglycan interpeptide bridge formation enzyme)
MLKAVKYKFSEASQQYWDFVHKHGTIYQSKPYLECLAASGREPLIVGVFDGDVLVGGVAVTVGRKILNFPISATIYYGPVVKDTQIVSDVLRCIANATKTVSLIFSVTILPEHADIFAESWELSDWEKKEIEFIKWDISNSLESVWGESGKTKRKNVRRARRDGVIIKEIETPQEVEQSFELYSISMHKSGLDPGSLPYYKNLIDMLKPAGLATGFLALHPESQKPIACSMLLLGMHGEAVHLTKGHDYEFRKFRGPDLLMWHCVEFLKSKGFTVFDLVGLPKGDSPRVKSICEFKLAWTGVYGRRYPSYELSRGNFGLSPKFVLNVLRFSKKLVKFISGGFAGE